MKKILEVNNLQVSFHTYAGEVQSVRGVTFDANEGEILAIVGESGCGKSVTSKTVMGLINTPPGEIKAGSEVLYLGKNILGQSEKEWEQYRGAECAMIFQDALTSLNPTMQIGKQVMENITNHAKVSKEEARKQAVEMLKLVKIPDAEMSMKKYPHELSGGMRQRVMIAIALAGKPKVLIADEPTTALDVTIQAQVLSLMKELNERLGTATILITHNLGCASSICDRIIVMYGGKIMEEGTTEEIFYEPHHPYTMGLLNSVPKVTGEASKERLVPILGTPPDMLHPPTGCPFYPRCKYAMKVCASMPVPEQYISDTHRVSCFMCHPQAPRNEEYESQKGGIRHAK